MKKTLRFLSSRRETRLSAASALSTSAAMPDSGFSFVGNSQGASAAVGELSRSLDTALEGLEGDFDGWFLLIFLSGQWGLYLYSLSARNPEYFTDRLAAA
jgi:hypothetical protein